MREIKFQVLDEDTKEFLGYEVFNTCIGDGFYCTRGTGEDTSCSSDNEFIKTKNILGRKLRRQYTGLKDINESEIYEGDIVYIAGAGNCKVEWDECHAGWIFDSTKEAYDYQEVIDGVGAISGNIYETPELIK